MLNKYSPYRKLIHNHTNFSLINNTTKICLLLALNCMRIHRTSCSKCNFFLIKLFKFLAQFVIEHLLVTGNWISCVLMREHHVRLENEGQPTPQMHTHTHAFIAIQTFSHLERISLHTQMFMWPAWAFFPLSSSFTREIWNA